MRRSKTDEVGGRNGGKVAGSHEVRGSLVKGDVYYYISTIVWTTYIRYSFITHDMQMAYLIITVSIHYYTSLHITYHTRTCSSAVTCDAGGLCCRWFLVVSPMTGTMVSKHLKCYTTQHMKQHSAPDKILKLS